MKQLNFFVKKKQTYETQIIIQSRVFSFNVLNISGENLKCFSKLLKCLQKLNASF